MRLRLILILLVFSFPAFTQNIGLGTLSPTEKLDVNGNIKADSVKVNVLKMSPNAGIGKILSSDAIGNAAWQSPSGIVKAYNGLSQSNDTINLGGRLYRLSEIKLAQNELSIKDIGSTLAQVATSTPAGSTIALSASPITQTFIPTISCQSLQVQLNITAVNGGIISLQIKNDLGIVLAGATKNYSSLTNGLDAFGISIYLDNSKTYTLSIAGNANAFINYDASSNPYPQGTCSIGPNADIAFSVSGNLEESLLSIKNNKVGIGTINPGEKLDVNGNILATNIIASSSLQLNNNPGAGKILTSNATGVGSWSNANTTTGSILLTANLYGGAAGGNIPILVNVWEFFGPTTTVTLTSTQRVIMTMIAVLGRTAAGNTNFNLDIGYQLQPPGTVTNASGGNYMDVNPAFSASSSRSSYSMSGSFKPGVAGTYKIGAMIRCATAIYLNNNDFVNGYYMIVNE